MHRADAFGRSGIAPPAADRAFAPSALRGSTNSFEHSISHRLKDSIMNAGINRRRWLEGSLALAGLGFAGRGLLRAADDKPPSDACVKTCLECAAECKECSACCRADAPACAAQCEACHHMCLTCAVSVKGKLVDARAVCELCEKVCTSCAASCEKCGKECCKKCRDMCLACAKACREARA